MNSWIFLGLAIGAEVLGTTCMKYSAGLSKIWPALLMFCCYGASLGFLSIALKTMEIGIAYAIWAGVGTAAIAAIGMIFFQEGISLLKFLSLGLVIVGVVGLHLSKTQA